MYLVTVYVPSILTGHRSKTGNLGNKSEHFRYLFEKNITGPKTTMENLQGRENYVTYKI